MEFNLHEMINKILRNTTGTLTFRCKSCVYDANKYYVLGIHFFYIVNRQFINTYMYSQIGCVLVKKTILKHTNLHTLQQISLKENLFGQVLYRMLYN